MPPEFFLDRNLGRASGATRDRLRELVDWLQEEHGPVTEDERAAVLDELKDLDTEHERRRPSGQHNTGEAD